MHTWLTAIFVLVVSFELSYDVRRPNVVAAFPYLNFNSTSRDRWSVTVDPRYLKRLASSSFVLSIKIESGNGNLGKNVDFLQSHEKAKLLSSLRKNSPVKFGGVALNEPQEQRHLPRGSLE